MGLFSIFNGSFLQVSFPYLAGLFCWINCCINTIRSAFLFLPPLSFSHPTRCRELRSRYTHVTLNESCDTQRAHKHEHTHTHTHTHKYAHTHTNTHGQKERDTHRQTDRYTQSPIATHCRFGWREGRGKREERER